jgi:hypothetical protein
MALGMPFCRYDGAALRLVAACGAQPFTLARHDGKAFGIATTTATTDRPPGG